LRPRSTATLALLLFGLLFHPDIAKATWPASGVAIGGPQAKGNDPGGCPDGSGGWYITWEDYRIDPSYADVRIQHLAPSGDPAVGWPLEGIVVSGGPKDELYPQLTQDGQGGVLVTWEDERNGSWDVYAQRYTFGGSIYPGWVVGGNVVVSAPSQQESPKIASDGAGGAYVIWMDSRAQSLYDQCYAQHVMADGSIAAGWPPDGLNMSPTSTGDMNIASDGNAGCFVIWTDDRMGGVLPNGIDVYAQHLLANGTLAAGWQPNGNLIIAGRGENGIVPDGSGGFYAASGEYTQNSIPAALRFWLSRFTTSGAPALGWTTAGIPLQSTIGDRNEISCTADSMGGFIACWDDGNSAGADIYAVRILPSGSVAPGWTPNGAPISDVTSPTEYTASVGPDGMGGAFLAWEKVIGGFLTRSYVQHLSAHGAIFGGWPTGGLPVASSTFPQTVPRVSPGSLGSALVYWHERPIMAQYFVADGIVATALSLASTDARTDRVMLVWQGVGAAELVTQVERRDDGGEWERLGSPVVDAPDRLRYEDRDVIPGTHYAYRLAYVEDGVERFTAETSVEVPSAAFFALDGLHPNPAIEAINVSFSLPTASSATLELLDLAGRRVIDREVGGLGVGRHVLRLDSGERIAPGVYWLRLRQGAQQALARAVVMH